MKKYSIELAGKNYEFEIGKLAPQADGAVFARCGDTTVLATVTVSDEPVSLSYLPLSVNYLEKYYSYGKIKSSRWDKREARPSEKATLAGRIIDRGIRPLIPKEFRHEIGLVLTIFSIDGTNDPVVLGALASTLAMSISSVPFAGPLASCRVGLDNDKLIINPTNIKENTLDLFITATAENVVMIDARANEVPDNIVLDGIMLGQKKLKPINKLFQSITDELGIEKKDFTKTEIPTEIKTFVEIETTKTLNEILYNQDLSKKELNLAKNKLKKEILVKYAKDTKLEETELIENNKLITTYYEKFLTNIVRDNILKKEMRVKKRKLDEIRPLKITGSIIPRVHGSGLFERGETHGLTILTLGWPGDALLIEDSTGEHSKRYLHHYNFPSYSVGEAFFKRFVSNREIGHGALAEKALLPVLPTAEDFPYTIRLVTEILSSNGSSSMAATCGSTIALLDGGVPIKRPVAGIAMGLISEFNEQGTPTGNHKILTDIQDIEDAGGDMDFKVTGTIKGITAIQMDIKVKGLSKDVFIEALTKAKKARLTIIDKINEAFPIKKWLSATAPLLSSIQVKVEQIRTIIGKGGETINKIIDTTGAKIDIDDTGKVVITAPDKESGEKAIKMIKLLTYEPKVGDSFNGKIVKIFEFWVLVEFAPGHTGMLHQSMMAERYSNLKSAFKLWQEIKVKIVKIERERIALTNKFN